MPHYRLRLALASFTALLLGTAMYASERSGTPLNSLLPPLELGPFPLSGNLPSLLHAYAFALLWLALTRFDRRGAALSCVGWWGLVSLVELAQLLPPLAIGLPGLELLASGTFDPADLFFAACGILFAYSTARAARGDGDAGNGRVIGSHLMRSLLLAAAIFSTVATSSVKFPGSLTSDMEQPCPGRTVTLSWKIYDSDTALLTASNPQAVDPPFEARKVDGSGQLELTILDDVAFVLVPSDERSNTLPAEAHLTVIPEGGRKVDLHNQAVCNGAKLEWDTVDHSLGSIDPAAVIDTVQATPITGGHPYSGPLFVEHRGVQDIVDPSSPSTSFHGTPLSGPWELRPTEPLAQDYCAAEEPPGPIPQVILEVRFICPAGAAKISGPGAGN